MTATKPTDPQTAKRPPIRATLTIHAPVRVVWDALCTADGLASWFPLEARVRPGPGGSVFTSWRNEYEFEMPIRAWEPMKRVSWQWGTHANDHPEPSVVDFHLESNGNDTVLRMVHHGFDAAAQWQDMYDGTVRGWDFELNSLKTYAEHHAGKARHVAHVRALIKPLSRAQAFQRILAPGALVEKGSLAGLTTGDRFDVTLTGGQRLTGTVRAHKPDMYLCMDIDNLDHAVMRIDLECCNPATGDALWLWLSTWGERSGGAKVTDALNAAWMRVMRSCFASALPIGARADAASK